MWPGDRLGGSLDRRRAAAGQAGKSRRTCWPSAAAAGQVDAAVLYVRHRHDVFARSFGAARSVDALFLLGSISKPMTAAALMTLYDQGKFQLDDPVRKFLPEFTGAARDRITVRQLLTHVSGLPDQLPENAALRKRHAPLSEFVAGAVRTPLLFEPGSRYEILEHGDPAGLRSRPADQRDRVPRVRRGSLFRPLEMKHSALGLGRFPLEATMRCQAENAAPESGAGDPAAREWDWNSPYWRRLGVAVGRRARLGPRRGPVPRRVPRSAGQGGPAGDRGA